MSRFLETHPKIAAAVFGGVLLLCATLAHAGIGNPAAACSTLGGGTGACYVDCRNGSSANPGTFDQPWRTPISIGLHAFAPGDTISLHRDCTWNDGITLAALAIWAPSTVFNASALIRPLTANSHYYKNTASGIALLRVVSRLGRPAAEA